MQGILETIAYSPFTWIAVLFVLVLLGLTNVRLGPAKVWRPSEKLWLNAVSWFVVLFLPVLLALFLAVLVMLALVGWQILGGGTIAQNPDDLRWYVLSFVGLLTALGGIIGTPVALIRIWTTERQTATQEEALFNDKIKSASEGLAARRQVTRVVGHGATQRVLTKWQDDIVTHAAAIDRLEGLVKERPEAAERIARLLSAYVVEQSREYPAEEPPEGASPKELWDWARDLHPAPSAMARAAQTLGRLRRIPGVAFPGTAIDLRDANLQGIDLNNLDFSGARLERARMQGARLESTKMQGAQLWGAGMQEAVLRDAQMEGADLSSTRMRGAQLWGTRIQGAVLRDARMEGADLCSAQMHRANLQGAQMDEETSLKDATLGGAFAREVDWSIVSLSQDQINSMFGDASVTLPLGLTHPAHWPDTELDAGNFQTEYNKWRADPASYTPPQDRA